MARWLPVLALGGGFGTTTWLASVGGFLLAVICVLGVAAVVLLSCAIHLHFHGVKDDTTCAAAVSQSARAVDSPANGFHGFNCFPKYSGPALMSSSRKLLISKKWGRREEEDEVKAYDRVVMEEEGGGDSLWQRTILMGERCQPPDFSGAIIYDNKGNRLTKFPPRSRKLNVFHLSLEQKTQTRVKSHKPGCCGVNAKGRRMSRRRRRLL